MAVAKRLLKDISDAVVLPSPEELYRRACEKLADAKAELADVVARQLKYDAGSSRIAGQVDAFIDAKKALKAKVEKLEGAALAAKSPLLAARPKRPLLPHEQVLLSGATFHDVYAKCPRGSKEAIAAAEKERDDLVREWRLLGDNASREKVMVKLEAARLKAMVLAGPPYSERRARTFSKETIANERKKLGLE